MSLRDFERFLTFIPVFCLIILIFVLLLRFFQIYIAPHFALGSGSNSARSGNLQAHRFATHCPRNSSYDPYNRPMRQDEIPSNTPYPTQNVMPIPQQSHLPQNSRLIQKKLVVCKIFPNEQ
ncbi:uncharacterized protein LOC129787810 [Lutzomyia longipalpis]|uniref:uncharacterized protein LOC129787810 n=1 Tax=Lutzomyia longipalpis TaxID=7200 RepID=UPI002484356D|nr:uncharacterized protein LOC129787810 [Lutzomyia longipalpis]